MAYRKMLPLLALLGVLLMIPATASASRYRVGIGEQSASMFDDPLFTPLHIKRVRYIVPWDWQRVKADKATYTSYLDTAHAAGKEVLVHFTASRGCYVNGRYSKARHCRLPSTSAYLKSFRAFHKAFGFVKVYGAWNEANHHSQPTYKSPKRAAQFYNALKQHCKGCTVVAADLLDSSNLLSYTRRLRRFLKGSPKLWGLHNYSDVNRKRSRVTRPFLRAVPGQVWLTETGGIVNFKPHFPNSPSRAASRISYLFKLADQFSRKRKGYHAKITRIYPYEWKVDEPGERFDAALVGPDGQPRKGYSVFKAKARTRSK